MQQKHAKTGVSNRTSAFATDVTSIDLDLTKDLADTATDMIGAIWSISPDTTKKFRGGGVWAKNKGVKKGHFLLRLGHFSDLGGWQKF